LVEVRRVIIWVLACHLLVIILMKFLVQPSIL
jgi:hypothetical protein